MLANVLSSGSWNQRRLEQAGESIHNRLREHTSLRDAKEEASSEETGVVLHEALADGDEAECEHADREPDVRF